MVRIKLTSGAILEVDSTEEAILIAKALVGKAKRGRPKKAGKKTADMKAYRRAYYQANKERIRETSALWRQKNREKIREYHRKWNSEHRDKIREYNANRDAGKTKEEKRELNRKRVNAWRKRHIEHYRKYQREYQRMYKAKKRTQARKVKLTEEQKLEQSRAYGRAYYWAHREEILKKAKAQRWLENGGK